jgi:hypothetical protein
MKSASECRRNAAECRALAKQMGDDHRRQTLEMANIWETLAVDIERAERCNLVRARRILKHAFGDVASQPVPDRLLELMKRLKAAERRMRRRCLSKGRGKSAAAGLDSPTRPRSPRKPRH